jgi:transcriptional regulator with XRE-family HTH domain
VLIGTPSFHERQARVVELRYFGGLTNEEVAHTLGVSLRTVVGLWSHARAWLRRNARLPDETRIRRLAGYLQRRGFPASVALEAMRGEGMDVPQEE